MLSIYIFNVLTYHTLQTPLFVILSSRHF